MNTIQNFDFKNSNILDLLVEDRTENQKNNIINYGSFVLINPKTEIKFPEFDEPFFNRMDATLKHVLHCFDKGWISSERQVFYSSNECLTTIQFIYRENRIQCNVFQRSSNVNNLKEDVEFLNWFLNEHFKEEEKELNIFVSMPHRFTDRETKVG